MTSILRAVETTQPYEREKSERCDKKVGAPENRIEWLKPYPDAPAQKPQSPVLGSIVTAHARIIDLNDCARRQQHNVKVHWARRLHSTFAGPIKLRKRLPALR